MPFDSEIRRALRRWRMAGEVEVQPSGRTRSRGLPGRFALPKGGRSLRAASGQRQVGADGEAGGELLDGGGGEVARALENPVRDGAPVAGIGDPGCND
jgi:hypothetical protein